MEELDLKGMIELFWSKILQIILIIIIFIGLGIVYTLAFVTPKYTSSTTFILTSSEDTTEQNIQDSITTADIALNSNLVSTYNEIIKSKKVARKVISNLGIDATEEAIINNITVTTRLNTEMVELTVTNENPDYAAKIANETVKVFSEEVANIYNLKNLYVIDEAEVASTPSNINHLKDVAIFAFIGIIVAVVYVIIANMLDTTVKTAEDIEKEFQIPVLVSIPLIESFNVANGGKNKWKKK